MTYRKKTWRQVERDGGNKYNAKGTSYDGKWYHSKKEARYAEQLDWLLKAGEIKEWRGQYPIDLMVNGIKITRYYMDFRVVDKHDTVQFHEVKGFETDLWRVKWRLLEATLDEVEPGAEMVLIQ